MRYLLLSYSILLRISTNCLPASVIFTHVERLVPSSGISRILPASIEPISKEVYDEWNQPSTFLDKIRAKNLWGQRMTINQPESIGNHNGSSLGGNS